MTRLPNQENPSARTIRLVQITSDCERAESRTHKRRRYCRWRIATLIGVHLLIALHIAHWMLAGRTLAPLELNEVMHTLELGIVTAGFVFMCLIVLSVAVFGRFFCSWGCHILALQDLCAWLLRTMRIRANPVRSRVLLFVAPGAMFYMFVWPQINNVLSGRRLPDLHLRDDTGGWASFVTDDFWRNLPGPGIALFTFAVCGFAIVYVLGTRSFCQYVCPYGAIFGIMDRLAPGRIKVDPLKCTSCGFCTGVCESHVRIHEEIERHGCIVDPGCLKDLDCVAACPEGALSYGWTRPALHRSFASARRQVRPNLSVTDELFMAIVFITSLLIIRGLYGIMPFLLSLAIAAILSYLSLLGLRLTRVEHVRLNAFQLKIRGRITPTGVGYLALLALAGVTLTHSGVIRFHEVQGNRALKRVTELYRHGGDAQLLQTEAQRAIGHFAFCENWGLMTAPDHHVRAASAYWAIRDVPNAERHWTLAIRRDHSNHGSRLDLAVSLVMRGEFDRAEPLLQEVTSARESSERDAIEYARYREVAWRMLGTVAIQQDDDTGARSAFGNASAERSKTDQRGARTDHFNHQEP